MMRFGFDGRGFAVNSMAGACIDGRSTSLDKYEELTANKDVDVDPKCGKIRACELWKSGIRTEKIVQ
jgi:hypothetical protein